MNEAAHAFDRPPQATAGLDPATHHDAEPRAVAASPAPGIQSCPRRHDPEVISSMIDALSDPGNALDDQRSGRDSAAPPPAGPSIYRRASQGLGRENGTSHYDPTSLGTPSALAHPQSSGRIGQALPSSSSSHGIRRILASCPVRPCDPAVAQPTRNSGRFNAGIFPERGSSLQYSSSMKRMSSARSAAWPVPRQKSHHHRAQIESSRSETDLPCPSSGPEMPAYISISTMAARLSVSSPPAGNNTVHSAPPKWGTKSISGHGHMKSSISSIAESIPTRMSSLYRAEKRAQSARKRSHSNQWVAKNFASLSKKKSVPLNDERVLDELGENDKTVQRIRELKKQKEHRRYQQERDQTPDQSATPRQQRPSPPRRVDSASSAPPSKSLPEQFSKHGCGESLSPCDPLKLSSISSDVTNRGEAAKSAATSDAVSPRRLSIAGSDSREFLEEHRASIDADIENFLSATRLNRSVRHPKTSRLISFAEVGDPKGHAVFVCAGMGVTRFVSSFYDELANSLGLRLITPERPGVGRSQPYTDKETPGPISWHEDVHAICMALDIERFSLLAHSAGAIYALATALIIPHMVKGRIYLLAPWIPPSQFEGVAADSSPGTTSWKDGRDYQNVPMASLPRSQRLLRVLPVSLFKAANSSLLNTNTNSTPSSLNLLATNTPPVPGFTIRPKSSSRRNSSSNRRRSLSLSLAGNNRPDSVILAPPIPDHYTSSRPLVDDEASIIRSANADALATASSPPPASLLLANPARNRLRRRGPRTSPQTTAAPLLPQQQKQQQQQQQQQKITLSATAFPTDADLMLASTHLSAAQHANDLSALRREAHLEALLVHRLWAASTRASNPADELLVCLERRRPIGFRYGDVRKPLVVLHGSEDRRVALRNVRWLVGRMNAARRERRATAVVPGPGSDCRGGGAAGAGACRGSVGLGITTSEVVHGSKAGGTLGLGAFEGFDFGIDDQSWDREKDKDKDGDRDRDTDKDKDKDEQERCATRDASGGDTRDNDDNHDKLDGDCELRVLDGQGHGLMADAGVMGDVLAEISGEHVSTGKESGGKGGRERPRGG